MGEKVTDFTPTFCSESGQNFKNRGHLQKTSDFIDNILIFCPHLCACVPIRTCTCLRSPVCVRCIRTLTSQQHKYSGYFNICSFSQKKYVVSERNLPRWDCREKQIINSLFSSTLNFITCRFGFTDCVFEKTAFSCAVPNSVDIPCGHVGKSVGVCSTYPNGLVLLVPEYESSLLTVHPPVLYKVWFIRVVLAHHGDSLLTLVSVIDNDTARRFERCKQPSDLCTANSKVLHHPLLANLPTSNSTSTFLMFTQHKLVIANITNKVTKKIPFQFVHEFTEGIVLLVVLDYYITSVWHTNPAHLIIIGLRGNCYKVSIARDFEKRRLECLVKNTPSLCVTDTEHLLYFPDGYIVDAAADVIHFYGNEEAITIPGTSSFDVLLNGTDYNIVSPLVWVDDDLTFCHNVMNFMDIKIPCKSHCGRTGLYAGYRMTLFQKVFIRYPFTLPPYYTPIVTIAPQMYNEFLNHARNVNFVLTFRKR